MATWLLAATLALGAEPLAFAGIDYSHAKFIGTGDFEKPGDIFPGMLNRWNQLWVEELLPKMPGLLGSEIALDNDGVFAVNAKAGASQIERRDGGESTVTESHVTPEMIQRSVRKYEMRSTSGQGLVLVVDRLVKLQERGCAYIVYFDVASRDVQKGTRQCREAGGFGFRNYWFRPVKTLLPDLAGARP